MDCDALTNGCPHNWCCQVCGYYWSHRQRQLADQALSLRAHAAPVDEKGEQDLAYLRKVEELHEQRVSAEHIKKFRSMMRKDRIPSMPWKILGVGSHLKNEGFSAD
jgi:hypothetical protein